MGIVQIVAADVPMLWCPAAKAKNIHNTQYRIFSEQLQSKHTLKFKYQFEDVNNHPAT